MRPLILVIVVSVIVGWSVDGAVAAQSVQAGCKSMSEDDSASLTLLRQISTAADPVHSELRDSLGLPSSVQESEVVFVTDSATCAHARAAYDSVLGVPNLGRVVAVFKVRDITAVTDSSLVVEGWHLMMYFSPQWSLLSRSQWP